MNTGRTKAEGQLPREGERLQPEMQLSQKVEHPPQTTSKLHTNIIFNAYSFFQIQKRATPSGKVCFEYLPLKIYVIVAKSPNLQRCLTVDLSNKTSNAYVHQWKWWHRDSEKTFLGNFSSIFPLTLQQGVIWHWIHSFLMSTLHKSCQKKVQKI